MPSFLIALGLSIMLLVSSGGIAAARDLSDAPFAPSASDPWADTPADQRGALRNNSAPPSRLLPLAALPPLPEALAGTIRRVTVPAGMKVAALTFDMCELEPITTGYDVPMVRFLREEQVPATFFMGGKWMRTHAGRVRQVMAEPLFEIGNHAWTHGNFGIMNPPQMREQALWTQAQYEILREEALAEAADAGRPAPDIPALPTLFRLPYGRCTEQALTLLAGLGFQVIQWDVVADVAGDNNLPGQARDIAAKVRPGSIILFHANRVPKHSCELLKDVVEDLRRRGYRFVTVGELLRLGEPVRAQDGYFLTPGDNKALDTRFGIDGTGRKR